MAGDRHTPQGRRERALPASRVRSRPLAGAPRRRDGRVPRPDRVLSADLPHGKPEGPAGRDNPPRRGSGRRSRRSIADQLRGRQDPFHACPVSPVLRDGLGGSGRNRHRAAGGAGNGARDGTPGGAGRQQDLAGEPGDESGRHGRSNPLGRAGVATGRQEGIRPDCSRRRECDESGRCTARALTTNTAPV